jgi:pimeloyl-ACP methyl ester carboxylesterase
MRALRSPESRPDVGAAQPLRYFEHDGLRLAYDIVGEGFPVVLHTGAGGDSRMWCGGGYVEGLGGFKVVLFDHRGHGASSAPDDPRGYSIEHHAADVVALADHLGFARFAFWGYSDGARVGYQLAASQRLRIAALVAQGTVDSEAEQPSEWLEAARMVRARGLAAILSEEEAVPAWLLENLLSTDREVVARALECFGGWSPWPLFPKIMAPVLIVAGELEDQGCADAAARIPEGRAVILPELGHIGAFAQSSVVLPHVLAFLGEACIRAPRPARSPG